jgi:hypothetical protein
LPGDPQALVAAIARPDGGLWLVWGDGGVWAMDGAPFYGAYGNLPPSQARAEADFIGAAYWPEAESADGYYLIHREVKADGEGIYRFDARVWRGIRP